MVTTFSEKAASSVNLENVTTGSAQESASLSRAPYLQLSTQSSVQVVWRTRNSIAPIVKYGTSRSELNQSKSDILVRRTGKKSDRNPQPLHSAPDNTRQFEAKISGLAPNTLYYYAIFDGETRLTPDDGTYFFRTHPKSGEDKEILIWAVGDSGTGNKNQKSVHNAYRKHIAETKKTPNLFLHVGDMAYSHGKDPQFQNAFFNIYTPTLRNTVCWPAMGNHEGYTSNGKSGVGPYYDAYVTPTKAEAGGVPSGKESYYSFDYGRAHFIVLNSHDLDRRPNAAMAQWLREDLAKTSPENTDWLIATWHHPPYTKGSHDSDKEHQLIEMRKHIMPILESAGVDLVLTGHSHIYERSMLMDGAYETPTTAKNKILDDGDGDKDGNGSYRKSPGLNPHQGTVQMVIGNGGAGLRRSGFSPVMKRSILQHGSTLLHIKGKVLSGTMLNNQGQIADKFQIDKSQATTAMRIPNPWQPGPPKDGNYCIKKNAQWHFLAGKEPTGNWLADDYDLTSWKLGKAGFGYGDDDDTTVLDMRKKYTRVYLRRNFQLDKPNDRNKLWLSISYDDAFILYINGKEILRQGVNKGR
ncbi:MAG: purple acid phosphatase family protein, partial [Akkermansiaceae bacterium]